MPYFAQFYARAVISYNYQQFYLYSAITSFSRKEYGHVDILGFQTLLTQERGIPAAISYYSTARTPLH